MNRQGKVIELIVYSAILVGAVVYIILKKMGAF